MGMIYLPSYCTKLSAAFWVDHERIQTNNDIIAINIVVAGTGRPLNAKQFTLNTSGTSNVGDIANAKLW